MARPTFRAQLLVACLGVRPTAQNEGSLSGHAAVQLDGVAYHYFIPPGAEWPVAVTNLWVYARLYRTNQEDGVRDDLELVIDREERAGVWRNVASEIVLSEVRLTSENPVVCAAWELPELTFPMPGLYALELWSRRPKRRPRRKAVEYIRLWSH